MTISSLGQTPIDVGWTVVSPEAVCMQSPAARRPGRADTVAYKLLAVPGAAATSANVIGVNRNCKPHVVALATDV